MRLELPVASDVVVSAYDLSGRKRGEFLRGRRAAGVHRMEWNTMMGAGIYVVRMEARPVSGPPVTLARKVARSL